MAHFAEIDKDNKVIRVVVVDNSVTTTEDGQYESELLGSKFLNSILGGRWIQTSYNGKRRKKFAGIGFTYDPIKDEFVEPEVPEELA